MQYRTLTPDDWQAYKKIRLKSLEEAPQAFESSFIEESHLSPQEWRARLTHTSSSFCLGAVSDIGELCGIAGFSQGHKLKTQHKAYLWGVYVSPDARGCGVAQQLIETIIHKFNGLYDISLIQLTVTSNNASALGLYQRLGFKQYGVEKDAIRVKNRSFDEILMCLEKSELI